MRRGEDAERGVHPGGDVGDRDTRAHAAPARLAGHADHPALGLDDEIERRAVAVRTVLAEPGDGAVDDPRLPRARLLIADAEPADGADAKILEHHVGAI